MASTTCKRVGRWWKYFVILLTPLLLLLPLLLIPEENIPTKANQCLFVMLWMAIYWCTEVLPLAITACIPIFMFPMLGILTADEVCEQFLTDIVMMFVGGIMVAIAVEKCNLHRRIAVGILHTVGTKPMWLMLGFMLPTGILSMWISNTATTAMMLPISEAVLQSLQETHEKKALKSPQKNKEEQNECGTNVELGTAAQTNKAYEADSEEEGFPGSVVFKGATSDHPDLNNINLQEWKAKDEKQKECEEQDRRSQDVEAVLDFKTTGDARLDKFAKGMTLAIAYAANTGGTATLIGTPPNTILKGHADKIWKSHGFPESDVTFASWLVIGMPVALVDLIFVWLWLTLLFNGIRSLCPCCAKLSADDEAVKEVIDEEYRSLGRISFAEVVVALMFLVMVLLWFFRSPNFMTGWADLEGIKPGYTHDAVVSIFIAFVLCILPTKPPTCHKNETRPVETLLDWKTIETKMPWGVVFLIGGGFCLAKASTASGLSKWIADGLTMMNDWPGWVMVFVICLITAFLTEITSNSATCTILMPIVATLAESIGYSPLYLMIPVGLSTSFAFMLPVATAPNAIAFSFRRLRIIDMVKAGFILNFICVGVVTLCIHTWGEAFFELRVIPWAVNETTTLS